MDSWPKQWGPLQRYTERPWGRDCPAHSQSASSLPVIYRCPRLDTIHPESRIPVTLPQTPGTVFLHARLGNVRTILDVNYKSVGVIKEVDILCWGTLWIVFTAIEMQWLYSFPFECTITNVWAPTHTSELSALTYLRKTPWVAVLF